MNTAFASNTQKLSPPPTGGGLNFWGGTENYELRTKNFVFGINFLFNKN